jgi:hypothetical protein
VQPGVGEDRTFLDWLESQGATSEALLRRSEWAVAHAVADLRVAGFVAAEAYATAALVLQPASEGVASLLDAIVSLRRHRSEMAPSLREALTTLDSAVGATSEIEAAEIVDAAEAEAKWQFSRGYHITALPVVRRVVSARLKADGADALSTLEARSLEAKVLNFLGRGAQAASIGCDVARAREHHPGLGPLHRSTLASWLFVAPILSALGRSDEALRIAKDVAKKREADPELGAFHPLTLAARFLVAQILTNDGRSKDAVCIAEDVAGKAEEHPDLGPLHPSTIAGRFLVAQIYDHLGRSAEALIIAEDVAAKGARHRSLGPLHPSTVISRLFAARLLKQQLKGRVS